MADPPLYRDTGNDTRTPRWVKVFGIIALVVVLLFVILMFAHEPDGRHGPGRHMRSGNGGQTPHAIVAEAYTPP